MSGHSNSSMANLQQEKRDLLEKLLKEKAAQNLKAHPEVEASTTTSSATQRSIPFLDRSQKYFPLSFAQQRIWLLDQLKSGNPAYNISYVVRLKGKLNLIALGRSLLEIQSRHEILSANFLSQDGEPVQFLVPERKLNLVVTDLSVESDQSRLAYAEELTQQNAQHSFDLTNEMLARANVIRLAEEDHLFQFVIHHIIFDGWSLNVFIQELSLLYTEFSKNKGASLPPVPVQYIDFASWEASQLEAGVAEDHVNYWKTKLGGFLPTLEMPLDKPRPEIQSFTPGKETLDIPGTLTEQLNLLSRQEGTTLFMTMLSAFYVLLAHYSGQEDIIVGTPIARRARIDVEKLIGIFVNNLALRTDLSGNITFRQLLERTRRTVLDAFAHQEVPFEKVLKELRTPRDSSRTPVFQVFFNLLDVRKGFRLELPGITVEAPPPPEVGSLFDLTLYVQNWGETIKLKLVYNTDLFRPERMAELMQQYYQLLEAVVAAPDKAIQELSLLTPGSAEMLPDPHQPLAANWYGSVHSKFTQKAIEQPDRIALMDGLGCWSYADLEIRSNQLAHYLIQNGIQRQDVVAIYARRNASLVWALLGALKAGTAFLILDPAYPAERLVKYISLAKPRGFINLESDPQLPEAIETTLHSMDVSLASRLHWDGELFAEMRRYSTQNPGLPIDPEDIAYIAFTSGSTGQPKGIVGTHRPLSHFFHWHTQTFDFREEDRFSMLSGLAHDPLLRDIFTPLWLGATLHIPDPEKMLAPGYLHSWIKEQQITVMHLTPAIEQLIVDTTSDVGDIKLETLRFAFFGGETLTRQHIIALEQIASSVTCVNFYGTTETPQAMAYSIIDTLSNEIHSASLRETIPLGKGIQGVQLLLLTNSGQLAGIGEVGEIYIRTPYLSQGYLQDTALTEERFLMNPFTKIPADHMYKTGDRGRYLPTGEVEFLGRNDNQVKIRGLRIELGEIESTLRHHPAVKQAVVVIWQTQATDKRLVAYIVPDAVQFPNVHELKGYLQQSLPSYMIPAHYVLIDVVPLTPNGKVDRRALPEPDLQALRESVFLAPQTQLQELLAQIWADVLQLERAGIHDNFFELGGHSLLATQIMSRIRRTIHVELPLRVLFEFPTIATMAAEIEALQKRSTFDIPPLQSYPYDRPPRLSFSQERMWFIHQLAPESAAYNMSSSLHIKGELNTQVVEQTFNFIIERHAILRTTFDVVDGVPVQIISPPKLVEIPVFDLHSLSSLDRDDQARQLIRTKSKQPFDLVNDPLLRVFLIKLDDQEYILFVCMHHIISDQWSSGVLLREFAATYNALCTNTPIPLTDLPVQYADYSLWQRDWLRGNILASKLAYWKKQLEGISVLDLPLDYPRPAVQTYNGSMERLPLSASTVDAVRNICRREQITPFMFFLGIFKILLLRYSGQQDVAVGSPIANRNWFEIESLMGTFVNTVVLRTQLTGNPTFQEFLHYIRDISLDAFNHQDFPFEKLIEELQPERDMSHSPLIQVLFNVQNAPVEMPQLYQNPQLTPLWPETRDAQFDLTLSVTTDIVPSMVLTYNTDLFKQETILRMLGHMETLIQSVLADPSQKILDLHMLPQAERGKQLFTWNDTRLEYPQSLCVHQLVEIQAEKTPNVPAVEFKDKQLTYQELNSRANQLAHYLRELGVTVETPVGISMERSVEMVVGLLAILKAGGTYIPLDPFFPKDRLEYMLDYSETSILLTHEQPQAKEMANLLRKDGLVIVNFNRDWQTISQYSDENPSINTQPDNLAYILFTSGSTGKPKGVQIPHRAVVNFLTSMQQEPGLTAKDRLLSVTTLSFDISVLEIFLPLITGACVVVLPGEAVFDGVALIQRLAQSNISAMQATPATWQMLIDADWHGDRNLKVLCGGEAMPKDLARWLTQHVGSVWNMYGPTETTVWSTLCEIVPSTDGITIGHPIANTRIYVLDKNFEPVPVGVAGELYIAGDGVARGYLKQPELTAEKFIPEPFWDEPGMFMYRTGDQARFLADGRIDFLGRADFQVKIRGFRIELGEIETILNSHPGIRQTVVIAREDTPGDKRLVAYLISENGQPIDTGELRQFIRVKLPEYMLPSAFVFLDELPMTPNRKVNRKALPAPDALHTNTERDVVLARTRTEAKLVSIWEGLLKTHPVGIKDNFFELGGHSLLAVHMFSRIKQELGVNLPLATLFREATIEYLAQVIEKESGPGTWSSLVEIESQGDHLPFFCVHGLTGDILWFRDLAHCLAPHYPFYGLQARGLDGIQSPIERIEEMATHYIEEIRLLQPKGPYYLGGASFGGTVALEIAQQLLAQGEQVSLLAIFDDTPINVEVDSETNEFRKHLNVLYRVMKNFPNWFKEFIQMGPSRMWGRVRRKLRLMQKFQDSKHASPNHQFDAEDLIDFASELSAHRQKLITCNYEAMKNYTPQPYAGNVSLFRAMNRPLLNIFDPELGWQKLATGRVHVYDIPSSHEGMFKKPHVDYLAEKLRTLLASCSSCKNNSA